MQKTSITNKDECKYFTLTVIFGKLYGTGLRSKKLKIAEVICTKDRTVQTKALFFNYVHFDADFVIKTKDGQIIKVTSTEERFFRCVQKYLRR